MVPTPRPTSSLLLRAVGRGVFGSDIAGYDIARAGYVPELLDTVFSYCADPHPAVIEIGPGTGLATRHLLDRDCRRLVAIEPDPDLARFLQAQFPDPRFNVECADFLSAPLDDDADLVFAACSFHWIEPGPGLARVRRALKPGGTLALCWHSYRNPDVDPFSRALQPLLKDVAMPPSEGAEGYVYLDSASFSAVLREAGFAEVRFRRFETVRTFSAREMVALYASFSFVRVLDEDARVALLRGIERLVVGRFGGAAPNVVLTPLYLARSPAADPSARN